VTVNRRGDIIERKTYNRSSFVENEVGLEMVAIEGGTFIMGTDDEEIERLCQKYDWDGFRREKPQHQVTLQPFLWQNIPLLRHNGKRSRLGQI
jgi:formylglycine-generating enzyme required for sulfatase activity